ncbi:MAG: TatD family hydrolase [Patescibacteria group bacterium]
MLIDSHCHPQFPHFDKDRDEIIENALKQGVFMICVGTDFETSKQALELAKRYDIEPSLTANYGAGGIWATAGLHPNNNLKEKFNPEKYEALLNQDKVVGFGEIGLDYYRTEKPEDQKIQRERLEQQIELAVKIGKPVVFHCRDAKTGSLGNAHRELTDMIKGKQLTGVIHSFTGTQKEAEKYLELDFCLGLNGIITFSEQYEEIVKYIPLEKILLETDAPYLTPLPFRSKRNKPSYVKYVAEKIAQIKNVSYNLVAEQTTKNTKELFRIYE